MMDDRFRPKAVVQIAAKVNIHVAEYLGEKS